MAKNREWSVAALYAADPTIEQLEELTDALERHAAVVGGGELGKSVRVQLCVDAPTAAEAAARAAQLVRKAFGRVGLDPAAGELGVEAITIERLVASNRGETGDVLVGLSDIAARQGFSRQRAHQHAAHPDFPKPVAALGRGRVWKLVDVERFLARPRTSGRPPKVKPGKRAS